MWIDRVPFGLAQSHMDWLGRIFIGRLCFHWSPKRGCILNPDPEFRTYSSLLKEIKKIWTFLRMSKMVIWALKETKYYGYMFIS